MMAAEKDEPILSGKENRKTPARLQRFLEVYAEIGQVRKAARVAGVSRMLHYRKLKSDAAYRVAFDACGEQAGQELEDAAVSRAVEGVKRPVLYRGKVVRLGRRILYRVEYSDMLLVCLLRRFRPALYGNQSAAGELTGWSVELSERLQAAKKRVAELRAQEDARAAS
jgi:hypothetical protein